MPALAKRLVRPVLEKAVSVESVWPVLDRIRFPGARRARETVEVSRLLSKLAENPVVAAGPFRGMRYPALRSTGSALLPKLLGTYESELNGFVEEAIAHEVSLVVDIGCAEGYFAVGFGTRLPKATILAFDIDPESRARCAAMGRANGAERLSIGEFCDPATLLNLPTGSPRLIFSDCEGYELQLFTEEVVLALRNDLVLIELHDFRVPGCKQHLSRRFATSHNLEFIPALTAEQKALTVAHPLLADSKAFTRQAAVSEQRPGGMEWMIARPR